MNHRLSQTELCLLLLLCFAGVTSGAAQPSRKPNLLIILTDDQGYGDVSTYHTSEVRTPSIDRLAAEGMLFTTMRANCTVCSPSRAALLTGRFPGPRWRPGGNPHQSTGFLGLL